MQMHRQPAVQGSTSDALLPQPGRRDHERPHRRGRARSKIAADAAGLARSDERHRARTGGRHPGAVPGAARPRPPKEGGLCRAGRSRPGAAGMPGSLSSTARKARSSPNATSSPRRCSAAPLGRSWVRPDHGAILGLPQDKRAVFLACEGRPMARARIVQACDADGWVVTEAAAGPDQLQTDQRSIAETCAAGRRSSG